MATPPNNLKYGKVVGRLVRANGDIYEGPYDPNRPWFSGDSTPEQLMQRYL